ncbi:MAG: hypothetical protein F6K61_10710 [Sphaerospermopsis sp. SIO1G1]|nr:hypothetical protein [Sphaerospermopsis sp. SIO1G1]
MVKLRIQEIAESKGISLEELDQLTGFTTQILTKPGISGNFLESSNIENITPENAANLRKKADKLGVSVLDLISSTNRKSAVKLKILETAKNQNLSLQELSNQSGVHPAIIAFYSTQAISREKLTEPRFQEYLSQISSSLNTSTEELQVLADLPGTKLLIEDKAKEKGITLPEMAVLINLPNDFIDLMATHPVDIDKLLSLSIEESDKFLSIKEEKYCKGICSICCLLSIQCDSCK